MHVSLQPPQVEFHGPQIDFPVGRRLEEQSRLYVDIDNDVLASGDELGLLWYDLWEFDDGRLMSVSRIPVEPGPPEQREDGFVDAVWTYENDAIREYYPREDHSSHSITPLPRTSPRPRIVTIVKSRRIRSAKADGKTE